MVVKRLRVQETDARDRQEAEHNFQREAQALAELNNPRFPQIMDFFTDPPLLYLVMEFVAGENLDITWKLWAGRCPRTTSLYRDADGRVTGLPARPESAHRPP